jgi:transglutaminase-like putative cysteine protease
MTSTLQPPTPPPATRPPAPPRPSASTTAGTPSSRRVGRRPRYQLASEIVLTLVTMSIVIGFGRVFNDRSYFLPLATVTILTHVYLAVVRRRGWGIALTGVVGVIGLLLTVTYLFFAGSTRLLLPSPDTISQAADALSQSYDTFKNVTAPAPVEPGFLLACSVALFFAAFLADWAAFRLWSAWEAVVPAATLFVFCSNLGSTVGRVPATAVFVATALAFILVHSVAKRETSAGWLSSDVDRGSRALLRVGALIAIVAVLAGIFVGPLLPGADSDPVLCVDRCAGSAGSGDRFTISPLVDIQSRLIDQANVEMFTVQSPTKAYWRMTSLDTFDGNSWRSKGQFTLADGDLDASLPATDSTLLDQQFHVEALAALWIPAAYQPVSVSSDAKARYQSDSSTLIVDTNVNDSDGLSYDVKSKVPNFTPDQLRTASTSVPSSISDQYLQLPNDFSVKAATTAKQVTQGQNNNYDKAKTLQDWFRTNFTYTLKVPPGHSDRAMDDFLDRKTGYCEQFAGTMAAMARSLGIPARVAVGFSWGTPDPSNPNLYHVMGEDAHAWPELYFGQYGWVAFEPTPGRGNPSTQAITGVQAQQVSTADSPDGSSTTSSTTVTPSEPTTTQAPSALQNLDLPTSLDASTDQGVQSFWDQWGGRILVVGTVLLVGFWAYVAAVTLVPQRRRRRRREQAHDASTQVQVAWEETIEHLSTVGVDRVRAETNDEFARRAADELPETTVAITRLARDADAAMYAAGLVDTTTVERARQGATTVNNAVRAKTTPRQRLRRLLDPRRLRSPDPEQRATRHRATSLR